MSEREYLPTGMIVGDSYRIVRVIGAGGFGVTYEAEDANLSRKVAIKEYYPEEFGVRDADFSVRPTSEKKAQTFNWGRDGFLEEARTLVRFRHPSIIQVNRVFEERGTVYMVMAYEQGPSFEGWLKGLNRAPTQQELDLIVTDLLDAIEHMHSENFLHRDIAPDNIIIRRDGRPVLIDFGSARKTIAQKTHVLTGLVKSGYSPHEQYATDGRHQGPWSDFYALGATLYRAVTGRPPEDAPSRSIEDTSVPTEKAALGTYRPAFLRAIDRCLAVRSANRPQTVAQCRTIFEAKSNGVATWVLQHLPARTQITQLVSDASTRIHQPHSNLPLILGSVAVLIAVTAGGLQYARRVPTQPTVEPKRSIEKSSPTIPVPTPSPRVPETSRPDTPDPYTTIVPGSRQSARDLLANGSDCRFCPEMVVVPPGNFTMGSPESELERDPGEEQLRVTISQPFAVGKFAITFDEWDACIADGGCGRYRPMDPGWGRGKRPVVNINWDDAKSYTEWLSRKTSRPYRLLSDAEREYVTRAGTTTPFWWGRTITPKQANYDGTAVFAGGGAKGEFRKRTVPVDSFAPNIWGLYQVHGNVYEWTEDCWNVSNSGNPGDGSARTTGECARHVIRGGCWFVDPIYLRSAYRGGVRSDQRGVILGFRVARTIEH